MLNVKMSDVKRLIRWCKKRNADCGQLNILIEDKKMQQANRINNRGLKSQVKFLLQFDNLVGIKKSIRHELRILKRYHMKQQSKSIPSNNKRIKKKKKKL